jgi:hypothetical protein
MTQLSRRSTLLNIDKLFIKQCSEQKESKVVFVPFHIKGGWFMQTRTYSRLSCTQSKPVPLYHILRYTSTPTFSPALQLHQLTHTEPDNDNFGTFF